MMDGVVFHVLLFILATCKRDGNILVFFFLYFSVLSVAGVLLIKCATPKSLTCFAIFKR